MSKLKVYHFNNGTGGGVFAVIRNLIEFSSNSNIENHIIYTINIEKIHTFSIQLIAGVKSEKIFYYSPKWNFYYTCKKLASLLPVGNVLVVAHDWLELGMMSNLGLQYPVVQIVHGNYSYYYELAIGHSSAIDAYICISNKICNYLKEKLPERNGDTFCLHFPVPDIEVKRKINQSLNLFYCVGNLQDINKQFSTIIAIVKHLIDTPEDYFFTIAGDGMTTKEFFDIWPVAMKDRVSYKGWQTNKEIIATLQTQDVFLLPSLAEGLPVSLVEAMKAGVVPLVTDWDEGVNDLITPGITGYYFSSGDTLNYVASIKKLQTNRQFLQQLSDNCIKISNSLFDPVKNTKKFEEVYFKIDTKKGKNKAIKKVYGSRLDISWMPNWPIKLIRSLYKKII